MRPKKSLGQNFLIDTNILSNIVNYGDIKSNDTILEIGPGTGNLTKKILERSPENLILIEKDKELAETLNKKFGSRVKIINDDILNCSNNLKFSKPIKVFASLSQTPCIQLGGLNELSVVPELLLSFELSPLQPKINKAERISSFFI